MDKKIVGNDGETMALGTNNTQKKLTFSFFFIKKK